MKHTVAATWASYTGEFTPGRKTRSERLSVSWHRGRRNEAQQSSQSPWTERKRSKRYRTCHRYDEVNVSRPSIAEGETSCTAVLVCETVHYQRSYSIRADEGSGSPTQPDYASSEMAVTEKMGVANVRTWVSSDVRHTLLVTLYGTPYFKPTSQQQAHHVGPTSVWRNRKWGTYKIQVILLPSTRDLQARLSSRVVLVKVGLAMQELVHKTLRLRPVLPQGYMLTVVLTMGGSHLWNPLAGKARAANVLSWFLRQSWGWSKGPNSVPCYTMGLHGYRPRHIWRQWRVDLWLV